MIARVHKRGTRVGGLLRYLYGPGRYEEHVNPRLVAAWDGAGDLADLEPPVAVTGRRDFRHLVGLLEEPVRAATRAPRRPVWHCSMRLAPEDRHREFSDATWGHMAREMLVAWDRRRVLPIPAQLFLDLLQSAPDVPPTS